MTTRCYLATAAILAAITDQTSAESVVLSVLSLSFDMAREGGGVRLLTGRPTAARLFSTLMVYTQQHDVVALWHAHSRLLRAVRRWHRHYGSLRPGALRCTTQYQRTRQPHQCFCVFYNTVRLRPDTTPSVSRVHTASAGQHVTAVSARFQTRGRWVQQPFTVLLPVISSEQQTETAGPGTQSIAMMYQRLTALQRMAEQLREQTSSSASSSPHVSSSLQEPVFIVDRMHVPRGAQYRRQLQRHPLFSRAKTLLASWQFDGAAARELMISAWQMGDSLFVDSSAHVEYNYMQAAMSGRTVSHHWPVVLHICVHDVREPRLVMLEQAANSMSQQPTLTAAAAAAANTAMTAVYP